MKHPLFLCGPANCGTNLVKAILGCNKDVILESEPFLPIYTSLRDKIIKDKNNPNLLTLIDSWQKHNVRNKT